MKKTRIMLEQRIEYLEKQLVESESFEKCLAKILNVETLLEVMAKIAEMQAAAKSMEGRESTAYQFHHLLRVALKDPTLEERGRMEYARKADNS